MASAPDPNKLGLVDCHCHLAESSFDKDIDEVVQRAKEAGVLAALVVAVDYTEFEKVIQLSDRYSLRKHVNLSFFVEYISCMRDPDSAQIHKYANMMTSHGTPKYPDFVLPCLGVHPVQGALTGEQRSVTLEDVEKAVPLIEKYIDKVAAIGEIGLDFQPRICTSPDDKEIQKQALKIQVDLAKKYNLPVNVHSRSAGRPTLAALKEFGADKVLMHAFDGKPSVAMTGVSEGYYFSIPPSIIRNGQTRLVQQLPVTNILLESDSPALGPEKQTRNEPANISISCDFIAKQKKLDISEMSKITTQNALKLFPKLARIIK